MRSLSRVHTRAPLRAARRRPGAPRATTSPASRRRGIFGGNSNWRGPVWFPLNYLLIEALERYHHFYGDELRVECPTGSGAADEPGRGGARAVARGSLGLFLPDAAGHAAVPRRRPALTRTTRDWRDLVLFYEYFHGDNGRGPGREPPDRLDGAGDRGAARRRGVAQTRVSHGPKHWSGKANARCFHVPWPQGRPRIAPFPAFLRHLLMSCFKRMPRLLEARVAPRPIDPSASNGLPEWSDSRMRVRSARMTSLITRRRSRRVWWARMTSLSTKRSRLMCSTVSWIGGSRRSGGSGGTFTAVAAGRTSSDGRRAWRTLLSSAREPSGRASSGVRNGGISDGKPMTSARSGDERSEMRAAASSASPQRSNQG